MRRITVASEAKRLVRGASRSLGIPDPLEDVGGVIEQSLAYPLGERYSESDPLAPTFLETSPENLSFLITPQGPAVTPSDRVEGATRAMRDIVQRRFGSAAANWLDGKVEAMNGGAYCRSARCGATLGSSFDRNGVSESFVQYDWGPQIMDALPAPLFRVVRTALESLPGLRPVLSAVRCGRTSGSQQVSFEIDRALPLAALQPMMQQLGLGNRHGGLMSAVAFVLGARFTLPPDAAMVTLRPTRAGVEMRLDVNLDALPDPPAQLMALMRLQMTERPRSAQGLDRWLLALTPDGYPGPGTVSVLSVWVRPDLPARLGIFLRSALFDPPQQQPQTAKQPDTAEPRAAEIEDATLDAEWAAPEWAPLN
jgi:hypothetical protein